MTELDDMMPFWEDPEQMERWLKFDRDAKYQREIVPLLTIMPEADKLLDMPCGSGFYSEYLQCKTYVGADQSLLLVDHCRAKYPKQRFRVVDARYTLLKENEFDTVLCMGLLCHGDKTDAKSIMEELARVSSKYIVLEHLQGETDIVNQRLKKAQVYERAFKKRWVQDYMKSLGWVQTKAIRLRLPLPEMVKQGVKRLVIMYEVQP
jgi:ubiquinone/menaquinone biosynthesis C-methylase UbiE